VDECEVKKAAVDERATELTKKQELAAKRATELLNRKQKVQTLVAKYEADMHALHTRVSQAKQRAAEEKKKCGGIREVALQMCEERRPRKSAKQIHDDIGRSETQLKKLQEKVGNKDEIEAQYDAASNDSRTSSSR